MKEAESSDGLVAAFIALIGAIFRRVQVAFINAHD